MKTHFQLRKEVLKPWVVTLCVLTLAEEFCTKNEKQVTCKNCLRMLKKRG